jgi:hypothetical protein
MVFSEIKRLFCRFNWKVYTPVGRNKSYVLEAYIMQANSYIKLPI